ncbi:MAG: serine protease [Rhodanobacter sp.]|nr:MAG: serine protease [Rhodanobacter sp.]TAM10887.1 MAG: serine protease [Rhodanobacter sp.]TAM36637.1 MAG: serine protease [Rhodanobacter sp.]
MIRHKVLFRALLGVGLLGLAGYVSAAEIKIANQDVGTGQGLDDSTPASPVGGNPGATRGEQARIVFQFAADLWGAVLQSEVPVTVSASFAKLACTANAGTLGSAGATYIFGFEDPAPAGALSNTWYHSALFDALVGEDAALGAADIRARFNGALGSPGCLEGASWYFGLDGRQPAGSINFLNVVLHEMAHGLGFSGFGNLITGRPLAGLPDIYSTFVFDNSRQQNWYAMTPVERVAAAVNDGQLVFTGANVRAEAPLWLTPTLMLRISAPAPAVGDYAINQAAFGPTASVANFSGGIVAAVTGATAEGCVPFDNAAAVAGHLALVVRGTCAFTVKVENAQNAGATGVIIANNQPGTIVPGGTPANPVNIPVVSVSQADGNTLRAHLAGLTGGLALGSSLAGADAAGNVQLYAPSVLAQGSSFSHYDTRLTPNALMEYAINPDLISQFTLDLTPALFKDEGWKLNEDHQQLLRCDTGIPTFVPGGLIVGANVLAHAKLLAGAAASLGEYRAAIHNYASELAADGLLSRHEATRLDACLNPAETRDQFNAWGMGAGHSASGKD